MVLRINRFHQDASGGTSKIRSKMRWASELRVPTFCDSELATSEVLCKMRVCVVHVGESATNGHYRALLVRDADDRDVPRYCDDGSRAKPIFDFDGLAGDVYVLLFVRGSPSSH